MNIIEICKEGDWKLIWEFENEALSLFNLHDDVGETLNLADKYPGKLVDLHDKLKKW